MITRFIEIDGVPYGCNGETKTKRGEYFGKSSDVKPVDGVANADIFYEMDTKKCYLFDGDTGAWIEQ